MLSNILEEVTKLFGVVIFVIISVDALYTKLWVDRTNHSTKLNP